MAWPLFQSRRPDTIIMDDMIEDGTVNPKTKAMVIYHGNCADGFAAAWVCRRHFKDSLDQVEFVAGVYQTLPPDVTDLNVYIVDFSYKKDVIVKMIAQCKSLTIIDHHKSAIDDLRELNHPKLMMFLGLHNSGSMLCWKYFFGEEPYPPLLGIIQHRDLWKFSNPPTAYDDEVREIQANIFSYPYDFEVWNGMMALSHDDQTLSSFQNEGRAIERKHFKDIAELTKVGRRRAIIADYDVPVVNLPYTMSSDAGHAMAIGEPFAACWMEMKEGIVFSLRSAEDGVDVSEVAKKFGGGGHKNAAGFKIDRVAFESIAFYDGTTKDLFAESIRIGSKD